MNGIEARLNSYQPQILSIYRIMFGLLYLQHGMSKWFGFPTARPATMSLMLMIAGAIELVGGILVIVGLFTRYAALIISGQMGVAYWIYANRVGLMPWAGPSGNNRASFIPVLNGGNTEVAYCFAFLLLVFFGAGIWSLDAIARGRR
jgi:putative oxidoreductase